MVGILLVHNLVSINRDLISISVVVISFGPCARRVLSSLMQEREIYSPRQILLRGSPSLVGQRRVHVFDMLCKTVATLLLCISHISYMFKS
jgi:hypothetical protein